jgi:predicted transcriptional regulator YheO
MDDVEGLLFEAAFRIADTIGRTFGSICEVAVHDLRMPTHSLVHLVNGNVTGRQLGAPIRDLIYRVLPEMDPKQSGLFNYLTELADGRRLKSSTTLIHDANGAPLIALCINIDVTGLDAAARRLGELSAVDGHSSATTASAPLPQPGILPDDVAAILRQLVLNIARPAGRPAGRLSKHERLAIIEFLERKGAFRIKGTIQLVASELGASEPTVYRDVDEVRRRLTAEDDPRPAAAAASRPVRHRRGTAV